MLLIIAMPTTNTVVMRLHRIALSDSLLARSSTTVEILPLSFAMTVSFAVVASNCLVRSGESGGHLPIGGSASQNLQIPPAHSVYGNRYANARRRKNDTLMGSECARFSAIKDDVAESRRTGCRTIDTRYSRKASQNVNCQSDDGVTDAFL